MALVTIVGYPCSGKSRFTTQLASAFETRLSDPSYTGPKLKVIIVNDESIHVSRSVYDDSVAEKSGRANLFAAVTRSLKADTITICDSLNYIKGFRYQMYCAAREAHARIHIATPPDRCREWHEKRGECSYKRATFENLIMRFEEPSSMVRWDSPLFTIPWDEAPPFDTIWNTITTGAKAPPTSAVVVVRPSLIPPARADVPQRPRPPPNTLKTLTTTTSTITTSLLSHINASPSASTFPIPSPPAPVLGPLFLHLPMRRVTLPEMQRLKRQYEGVQIKAQASGGRAGGRWAEWEVAVGFVGFLEAAWDTGQ